MICLKCRMFYRVKRSGVNVEELLPTGKSQPDVELREEKVNTTVWAPYKLWKADLLECPGCGNQVLGGFPFEPMSEHYKPDYSVMLEHYPPDYRIPDCGPRHLR